MPGTLAAPATKMDMKARFNTEAFDFMLRRVLSSLRETLCNPEVDFIACSEVMKAI